MEIIKFFPNHTLPEAGLLVRKNILVDIIEKLAEDKFSTKKISISTLNKLYVAMTRSRGDLYLIKASTFKKLQNAYIKSRYT